jgi:PAS domain S-box-containing protein
VQRIDLNRALGQERGEATELMTVLPSLPANLDQPGGESRSSFIVAEVRRMRDLFGPHRLLVAAGLLGVGLVLGGVALYSDYKGLLGPSHLSPPVLAIGVTAMAFALLSVLILMVALRDEELGVSALRVLRSAPAALLVVDTARRVRYANPACQQLLGRGSTALIGRELADLFPQAADEASLDEMFRGRPIPRSFTLTQNAPGTARKKIELVVNGDPGSARTYVVQIQDVTERSRLVEALAARAAELARSNRELEQFAYVASHDLQEPLRMVGSYTQLLESRYRGRIDGDADEFLHFAHDGAIRMKQLIDDLLLYARLDSRPLPAARVNVNEVMEEVVRNLSSMTESAHAQVRWDSLPAVAGDRSQIVQLFQNLVSNAIKFHGGEPPLVTITSERKGGDWEFCVSDNGIGIPPESQERIFLMFQRLHGRDEYPGSGIGLAVCKKVVERHGGRIWVESSGVAGLGSKFLLTLPADPVAATPPASRGHPVEAHEEAALQARTLIEERLRELA